MDKRGAKILVGCMVCTIIIVILFLIVIRLPRPICEFMVLPPEAKLLRNSAPRNMRSRDQSLLIRISAQLQTVHSVDPSAMLAGAGKLASGAGSNFSSPVGANPAPISSTAPQTTSTTLKPSLLLINSSVPSAETKPLDPMPNPLAAVVAASLNRSHPEPSKPSLADLTPPANKNVSATSTSLAPAASAGNHSASASAPAMTTNASTTLHETVVGHPLSKLYMPLELDSVHGKKLPDGRFRYTLNFNCSIVVLKLVRRLDRVYVDQASMEWRSTSNRKQKKGCELQISPQGTLGVDANQGAARCFHDGPIVYKCHTPPAEGPEVELHINSIEFEVAPAKNISQQFTQPRVACIL